MRAYLFASSKPNLNLPEVEYEEPLIYKLKKAMLAESALISNNLKIFLSTIGVTSLTATDLITNPQSLEDWSLKGILLIAVMVLARVVVVQQRDHKADMKELLGKYEKALKDGADDEDDVRGPKTARRGR